MPWAGSLQVKAFWVRKGLIGGKRGKWHKAGSAAWVTTGDQGRVLVQRRGLVPVGQREHQWWRSSLWGRGS